MEPSVYDHSPLIVQIRSGRRGLIPFRVLNAWCDHADFVDIIRNGWKKPILGTDMFYIVQKQKLLKGALKELHRRGFSDIQRRVLEAE